MKAGGARTLTRTGSSATLLQAGAAGAAGSPSGSRPGGTPVPASASGAILLGLIGAQRALAGGRRRAVSATAAIERLAFGGSSKHESLLAESEPLSDGTTVATSGGAGSPPSPSLKLAPAPGASAVKPAKGSLGTKSSKAVTASSPPAASAPAAVAPDGPVLPQPPALAAALTALQSLLVHPAAAALARAREALALARHLQVQKPCELCEATARRKSAAAAAAPGKAVDPAAAAAAAAEATAAAAAAAAAEAVAKAQAEAAAAEKTRAEAAAAASAAAVAKLAAECEALRAQAKDATEAVAAATTAAAAQRKQVDAQLKQAEAIAAEAETRATAAAAEARSAAMALRTEQERGRGKARLPTSANGWALFTLKSATAFLRSLRGARTGSPRRRAHSTGGMSLTEAQADGGRSSPLPSEETGKSLRPGGGHHSPRPGQHHPPAAGALSPETSVSSLVSASRILSPQPSELLDAHSSVVEGVVRQMASLSDDSQAGRDRAAEFETAAMPPAGDLSAASAGVVRHRSSSRMAISDSGGAWAVAAETVTGLRVALGEMARLLFADTGSAASAAAAAALLGANGAGPIGSVGLNGLPAFPPTPGNTGGPTRSRSFSPPGSPSRFRRVNVALPVPVVEAEEGGEGGVLALGPGSRSGSRGGMRFKEDGSPMARVIRTPVGELLTAHAAAQAHIGGSLSARAAATNAQLGDASSARGDASPRQHVLYARGRQIVDSTGWPLTADGHVMQSPAGRPLYEAAALAASWGYGYGSARGAGAAGPGRHGYGVGFGTIDGEPSEWNESIMTATAGEIDGEAGLEGLHLQGQRLAVPAAAAGGESAEGQGRGRGLRIRTHAGRMRAAGVGRDGEDFLPSHAGAGPVPAASEHGATMVMPPGVPMRRNSATAPAGAGGQRRRSLDSAGLTIVHLTPGQVQGHLGASGGLVSPGSLARQQRGHGGGARLRAVAYAPGGGAAGGADAAYHEQYRYAQAAAAGFRYDGDDSPSGTAAGVWEVPQVSAPAVAALTHALVQAAEGAGGAGAGGGSDAATGHTTLDAGFGFGVGIRGSSGKIRADGGAGAAGPAAARQKRVHGAGPRATAISAAAAVGASEQHDAARTSRSRARGVDTPPFVAPFRRRPASAPCSLRSTPPAAAAGAGAAGSHSGLSKDKTTGSLIAALFASLPVDVAADIAAAASLQFALHTNAQLGAALTTLPRSLVHSAPIGAAVDLAAAFALALSLRRRTGDTAGALAANELTLLQPLLHGTEGPAVEVSGYGSWPQFDATGLSSSLRAYGHGPPHGAPLAGPVSHTGSSRRHVLRSVSPVEPLSRSHGGAASMSGAAQAVGGRGLARGPALPRGGSPTFKDPHPAAAHGAAPSVAGIAGVDGISVTRMQPQPHHLGSTVGAAPSPGFAAPHVPRRAYSDADASIAAAATSAAASAAANRSRGSRGAVGQESLPTMAFYEFSPQLQGVAAPKHAHSGSTSPTSRRRMQEASAAAFFSRVEELLAEHLDDTDSDDDTAGGRHNDGPGRKRSASFGRRSGGGSKPGSSSSNSAARIHERVVPAPAPAPVSSAVAAGVGAIDTASLARVLQQQRPTSPEALCAWPATPGSAAAALMWESEHHHDGAAASSSGRVGSRQSQRLGAAVAAANAALPRPMSAPSDAGTTTESTTVGDAAAGRRHGGKHAGKRAQLARRLVQAIVAGLVPTQAGIDAEDAAAAAAEQAAARAAGDGDLAVQPLRPQPRSAMLATADATADATAVDSGVRDGSHNTHHDDAAVARRRSLSGASAAAGYSGFVIAAPQARAAAEPRGFTPPTATPLRPATVHFGGDGSGLSVLPPAAAAVLRSYGFVVEGLDLHSGAVLLRRNDPVSAAAAAASAAAAWAAAPPSLLPTTAPGTGGPASASRRHLPPLPGSGAWIGGWGVSPQSYGLPQAAAAAISPPGAGGFRGHQSRSESPGVPPSQAQRSYQPQSVGQQLRQHHAHAHALVHEGSGSLPSSLADAHWIASGAAGDGVYDGSALALGTGELSSAASAASLVAGGAAAPDPGRRVQPLATMPPAPFRQDASGQIAAAAARRGPVTDVAIWPLGYVPAVVPVRASAVSAQSAASAGRSRSTSPIVARTAPTAAQQGWAEAVQATLPSKEAAEGSAGMASANIVLRVDGVPRPLRRSAERRQSLKSVGVAVDAQAAPRLALPPQAAIAASPPGTNGADDESGSALSTCDDGGQLSTARAWD